MSNITNVITHSSFSNPELTIADKSRTLPPNDYSFKLFSNIPPACTGVILGLSFSRTTTIMTKKILNRTTNFNLDQITRIGNAIGSSIAIGGLKYLDSLCSSYNKSCFDALSKTYDADVLITGIKIGAAAYPILMAACEGAGILPPQSLLDLNSITFDATMLGTGVTSLLFAYDIDPVLSVAAGAFTAYQICKSSG